MAYIKDGETLSDVFVLPAVGRLAHANQHRPRPGYLIGTMKYLSGRPMVNVWPLRTMDTFMSRR